ncbi:MAG: ion channel [Mycobacterium leprae]
MRNNKKRHYPRIWATVFGTTLINLALLFAADYGVLRGMLPNRWGLSGLPLGVTVGFVLWTVCFVWLVANPLGAEMRMVLTERVDQIDYVFLMGMAFVTISYYAAVFFLVERIDPGGVQFTSNTVRAADLLYFSTLTFIQAGFGAVTATGWWARLTMLAETLMGLGYLAGTLALVTNRLANEPPADPVAAQAAATGAQGAKTGSMKGIPSPDLAEGAAWVGGGAAGAALGSLAGPPGTIVGAIVGGAVAEQSLEHRQQHAPPQKQPPQPPPPIH